ncbi:MAG: HAD family phosphatase [Succinivibrio sp.]|nr:HAD family phosphatase [Succinivibrio sp.]
MQFPSLAKYKGLIFDLDGTLINSMPYHVFAWQEMGRRHGFTVDPDLIYSMGGVSSRDVVLKFRELGFQVGDIDTFIKNKIAIYRQHIDEVKTYQSIETILRQAKKDGKKIAAGSGS